MLEHPSAENRQSTKARKVSEFHLASCDDHDFPLLDCRERGFPLPDHRGLVLSALSVVDSK